MRTLTCTSLLLCAVVALTPAAVSAQANVTTRPAVMAALLRDLESVEQKLMGLGDAIPEAAYGWRPAEGVRSISEVLMHVAADNWFLPTPAGIEAPEATGIRTGDYPSVQAYENRTVTKAEALQALRESFAHLRRAMEAVDDASLARQVDLFGTQMTAQDLWLVTSLHLHEHLGQMIAYARSNDIVPPWSR
jgi:uncharacterized damage-inducible protein DinB